MNLRAESLNAASNDRSWTPNLNLPRTFDVNINQQQREPTIKKFHAVSVFHRLGGILALLPLLFVGALAHADNAAPYPGTLTSKSAHGFGATVTRLEKSIEAPIRIYVTEDADGKSSVTNRTPSAVFAPYGNAQLDAMARELDPIFDRIVRDALAG